MQSPGLIYRLPKLAKVHVPLKEKDIYISRKGPEQSLQCVISLYPGGGGEGGTAYQVDLHCPKSFNMI